MRCFLLFFPHADFGVYWCHVTFEGLDFFRHAKHWCHGHISVVRLFRQTRFPLPEVFADALALLVNRKKRF